MPIRLSILCGALFFPLLLSACSPQGENILKKVCFNDRCFDIEIAQTSEEKAKGLQFRKTLGKNNGMLFVFSKAKRQTFWMKDTFIPLDIIWIDGNKRIVSIMRDILPCKTEKCPVYMPQREALYVLEVNAGITIERGLRVGDQADFR